MQSLTIWHWIIIAILIVLVAGASSLFTRAISNRRPKERNVQERSSVVAPVSGEHAGLKGWLLLLGICIFVTPVITVYSWLQAQDGLNAADAEKIRIALNGETGLYVVVLLLQIFTIICLAQRSRRFKSFYIVTSIAIILLLPLDLIWLDASVSAQAGLPFGGILRKTLTLLNLATWIVTVIPVTIWLLYVIFSRRVANTFVR